VNRRKYLKYVLGIIGSSVGAYILPKWFTTSYLLDAGDFLKQRALLGELVEIIIPTTDSPGAKAALVHEYIANIILNCTDIREQNSFYTGLLEVEEYSLNKLGRSFQYLSDYDKRLVVEQFALTADSFNPIISKVKKKLLGEAFYIKLRRLTIEGYCQSRIGATKALRYDFIPGKFLARVPLEPDQKSWATK
jgi:hypothetical protein